MLHKAIGKNQQFYNKFYGTGTVKKDGDRFSLSAVQLRHRAHLMAHQLRLPQKMIFQNQYAEGQGSALKERCLSVCIYWIINALGKNLTGWRREHPLGSRLDKKDSLVANFGVGRLRPLPVEVMPWFRPIKSMVYEGSPVVILDG